VGHFTPLLCSKLYGIVPIRFIAQFCNLRVNLQSRICDTVRNPMACISGQKIVNANGDGGVGHWSVVIDPQTIHPRPGSCNVQTVRPDTKRQTCLISNPNGSNLQNGSNGYRTTGQPHLTWRAGGEGILLRVCIKNRESVKYKELRQD